MKKIVKICLMSTILLLTFACILCGSVLTINYIKFQKIPLNAEALSNSTLSIELYDSENKPMKEVHEFDHCQISKLKPHTTQAFISIEDKKFFEHNGVDTKRMAGAMLKNIKSMSLKEGASTISQQLIKNTHLSGEKTFERKLKEISLTKKLEKHLTKKKYLKVI